MAPEMSRVLSDVDGSRERYGRWRNNRSKVWRWENWQMWLLEEVGKNPKHWMALVGAVQSADICHSL